jgi:hypothetical protein
VTHIPAGRSAESAAFISEFYLLIISYSAGIHPRVPDTVRVKVQSVGPTDVQNQPVHNTPKFVYNPIRKSQGKHPNASRRSFLSAFSVPTSPVRNANTKEVLVPILLTGAKKRTFPHHTKEWCIPA